MSAAASTLGISGPINVGVLGLRRCATFTVPNCGVVDISESRTSPSRVGPLVAAIARLDNAAAAALCFTKLYEHIV
jgi:hypothetical protein